MIRTIDVTSANRESARAFARRYAGAARRAALSRGDAPRIAATAYASAYDYSLRRVLVGAPAVIAANV